MPLPVGTRVGVYEVIGLLGVGGMGEVYRARDTRLKREVALKTLRPAFVDDGDRIARFAREAEVLAALNHPNIAAIHGLEEALAGADVDERVMRALVMELVDGHTIADRVTQGPIPTDEALGIARQIALALEAAHEQGIVHRDLKPANIKLRDDGTVKVLDFGLAKLAETGATGSASSVTMSPTITSPVLTTNAGMLLGTAAYMSPEQAKGRPADKRSDMWAFGCVLFEMLTGKRAFEGEDVSETLAAVLRGEPDWAALPADMPPAVGALIRRCLERDKRRRVGDAAAALFVLDEHAKLIPSAPAQDRSRLQQELDAAIAGERRRARRRVLRLLAAAGAIGALLVAGAVVSTRIAMQGPPPRVTKLGLLSSPSVVPALANVATDVAVTPDGTRVVFFTGLTATTSLAVQALDQLEPTPLNGVAGGAGPFISSDGAWIGYWSQPESAIKKVPILGGPSVTVTGGVSAMRGATWLPDNTIIFALGFGGGGLWRVSAGSGIATPLIEVPPDSGESHAWPHVLPGGRAVLFTKVTGGAFENAQIEVLDLETKERKIVASRGTYPRFSPTGHVVYAVDGTLFAVGFDLKTLTPTTMPRRVLEGVVVKESGSADFDIAADGTLVYIRGAGVTRRSLVWMDRGDRQQPLPGLGIAAYRSVKVGPGGRQIAYETGTEGSGKLWIYDVARAIRSQITSGRGDDRNPLWMPDGRRIAFASNRDGKWAIFAVNADGTGVPERISMFLDALEMWPQTFSRDGKTLVVAASRAETSGDIMALNLEDGSWEPKVQTKSIEAHAAISEDGQWIAYVAVGSDGAQIYVERFPKMGDRRTVGAGTLPLWSADDRELYYFDNRRRVMMSVPVVPGVHIELGPPKELIGKPLYQNRVWRTYDVMPDGRFLIIAPADDPESDAPRTPIVMQNWSEELKRLAPLN